MVRSLVVPMPASARVSVPGPIRGGSGSVPVRSQSPSVFVADCERLDAYHVAVEFQVLASSIVATRGLGALRDQLDRASVSVVLNVAEGAGHFAPAMKANFYSIARGSAMECLAVLALLSARSLGSVEAHRRGRSLLIRVVAMLTKLMAAMKRRA